MSFKSQDERNLCSVELIKNEFIVYYNIKNNCLEFAKNIRNDTNSLKPAKSQSKHCLKDNNSLIKVK